MKAKNFLFAFLTIMFSSIAYCYELSASLGTYGIGAETKFKNKYLLEARLWYEPEITIFSLKPAIKFYNINKNIDLFAGFEYARINFNSSGITGEGYGLTPSVSAEYVFLERFFLKLEVGYSFITLSSKGKSISGPEWIITTGVGYKIW